MPDIKSRPTLERRLGPLDATAIVISNVIGVGIFTTPGIVAQMLPHPWAILSVWIAGGLLAFAGAMAYAELAALRPHAGGEYVYLRESFGPLAAFLTGWTSFVAGFSGAIAAGAVGAAAYLGRFIPAAGDVRPLLSVPLGLVTLSVSRRSIVALAVIAGLTLIHLRGLGPGRLLQNTLAGVKVAALAIFVALGFAIGGGAAAHFHAAKAVSAGSWLLALIPVMFSYSGWNAAAYVAEEVRDPGRNVPRALALGTLVVVTIYIALNALYLYALPIDRFAGSIGVGETVAAQLLGPAAASAIGLLALVIILGSLSAMVLAGPRVYFAMARDGLFFHRAARVHAGYRTPVAAIVAQALWSGLLVLSGTFEQLLTYTGFAVVLFAGVAVCALFVLRRRCPDEPRPFRAWGYPLAPGLFAVASLAIVLNAMRESPWPSAAGLAVIAAGIPLYWLLRRTPPAVAPSGAPRV
ncbi:MAG TPA: amino acid permease [Vicinamibacterales bacterium]|nr:amino acid permease [Vicinamibacterales bacterium]